jgi:colanic acid/amylovoran biosynthesis protein
MPQAWGAFERPDVRGAVVELTRGPRTLVLSRDPRSTGHLEAAGVAPSSLATRNDIVFAFDGGTPTEGAALLRAMGVGPGRTVVGIAPNMRVYDRSEGEGTANGHVRNLVALVRHCVDTLDVDVALLPSECAPVDRGTDDRRLCAMVRDEAQRDSRCHTSAAYVTAAGARAMIGRCDYVVGSRFHALVFALSQGVPCTAVGWSHKYGELMALFDSGEDSIAHEGATERVVIDLFEAGWRRRHEQRQHNLKVVAQLRRDVQSTFDEVASFLLEGGDDAPA